VYATFALIVYLGFLLRSVKIAPLRVAAAAFAAALIFYVTTNFAPWASSGIYPKTFAGLVACYVAAIPFFCPTLAGDLLYSALLFGGFAWAERHYPVFRPVAAG